MEKKVFHVNTYLKKDAITILILDKITLNVRNVTVPKEMLHGDKSLSQ